MGTCNSKRRDELKPLKGDPCFLGEKVVPSQYTVCVAETADPKETESNIKYCSVEERYIVGNELGSGGFSVVKEGTEKVTRRKVAIKFINKNAVNPDELKMLAREIEIMTKIQHKNVLQLIEVYDTETQIAIVMELVNGGELFNKIVEKGSYSEEEARNVIRQLIEGVDYLHNKGIAHRDLKPENLLCSENERGMVIKIADFGLSKAFLNGSMLGTSCGTPDYAAPEVLRMEGTYDNSVDMWSVGVITYVVLSGYLPFYGKTQPQLFEKILNAEYRFPTTEWKKVSSEAKDFIRKLLVLETDKRYTAKQCLEHPWLKMDTVGVTGESISVAGQDYINNYVANREKLTMSR